MLLTMSQTISAECICTAALLTWCVNDGKVWAELVLNLDNDLLCPKLLLAFQARIFTFYVVLQKVPKVPCVAALCSAHVQ